MPTWSTLVGLLFLLVIPSVARSRWVNDSEELEYVPWSRNYQPTYYSGTPAISYRGDYTGYYSTPYYSGYSYPRYYQALPMRTASAALYYSSPYSPYSYYYGSMPFKNKKTA